MEWTLSVCAGPWGLVKPGAAQRYGVQVGFLSGLGSWDTKAGSNEGPDSERGSKRLLGSLQVPASAHGPNRRVAFIWHHIDMQMGAAGQV